MTAPNITAAGKAVKAGRSCIEFAEFLTLKEMNIRWAEYYTGTQCTVENRLTNVFCCFAKNTSFWLNTNFV